MHIPVDSALIVAAASRAVQSLLVAMEGWSCEQRAFAAESFLKVMIQLLKHIVNLGSTLTLGEVVRIRRVKPI
jgi:hypothetical protein